MLVKMNKIVQFFDFCFRVLMEKSLHWSLHPKIRSILLGWYGARIGRGVRVKDVFLINLHNGFKYLTLHDGVFIGDHCVFDLVGTIEIGARTAISAGCSLSTHADPGSVIGNRLSKIFPRKVKGIRIGSDCWVGVGTIILCGVTIGNGSVVGAGTVVTKDIPKNVVVVGNPARIIREIA